MNHRDPSFQIFKYATGQRCLVVFARQPNPVIFASDVVLETAVLVSRPLETVFWRSWSWSWY